MLVPFIKKGLKMNISKVNSNCAFRGYLNLPVEEIVDEERNHKIRRRDINVKDITSIQDNPLIGGYGGGCIITCFDKVNNYGNKTKYYFSYDFDGLDNVHRTGRCRYTDINTILNAYNAAKDNDLVVKL